MSIGCDMHVGRARGFWPFAGAFGLRAGVPPSLAESELRQFRQFRHKLVSFLVACSRARAFCAFVSVWVGAPSLSRSASPRERLGRELTFEF